MAFIESLAITGVFSPLNSEQEVRLSTLVPNTITTSLSHLIGGIGFIERENATILNASLKKVMKRGLSQLGAAVRRAHLKAPIYITQNNGTLISLQEAIEYPILTLSAGQTNSFMGAICLTGLKECIVVDIGGTSTDIGLIKDGVATRSLENSGIGGIPLNFSMPNVLSIALGGGSYVQLQDRQISIGPESSAKNLLKESFAFGGSSLT